MSSQSLPDCQGLINGSIVPPRSIFFYATYSGPSMMMLANVEKLSTDPFIVTSWCKVDIERQPAVAEAFGIHNPPVLINYKEGAEPLVINGFVPLEELALMLKNYYGVHSPRED